MSIHVSRTNPEKIITLIPLVPKKCVPISLKISKRNNRIWKLTTNYKGKAQNWG